MDARYLQLEYLGANFEALQTWHSPPAAYCLLRTPRKYLFEYLLECSSGIEVLLQVQFSFFSLLHSSLCSVYCSSFFPTVDFKMSIPILTQPFFKNLGHSSIASLRPAWGAQPHSSIVSLRPAWGARPLLPWYFCANEKVIWGDSSKHTLLSS